ncbi:STAS domain-containing protein [Streptomyces sp. ASQP_92]|uniref:STAS domain-containing protein n=1 Tax=Streptomyces sp. ASQP_92 TaxID=2979116 RepID=UPI0021BE3170|nr:STAS domain-containing protein [Streptomyces sp. ASQP_92]MCT9089024.1 STAS domain-containing protein [Streptomyces sp. ASQP_92]
MGTTARPSVSAPLPLPPGLLPDRCCNARTYLMHGFTVVEVHGAVDLATAPGVQLHLDAATQPAGARVIVDLRTVEFFDCAVLTLLCRAHRRVREREGHLGVVCVRPWHRRILMAGRLDAFLQPARTVEEAALSALALPVSGDNQP